MQTDELRRAAVGLFERLRRSKTVADLLTALTREPSLEAVTVYADAVGGAMSRAMLETLIPANLPGGILTEAAAGAVILPVLKSGYDLIERQTLGVLKTLAHNAGYNVNALAAGYDADAAENLVKKLLDEAAAHGLEESLWVLDEPVKTNAVRVVDMAARRNVEAQQRAGLPTYVTRRLDPTERTCDWCRNLAGTYKRGDEPPQFYARHERCRCIIEIQTGSKESHMLNNYRRVPRPGE